MSAIDSFSSCNHLSFDAGIGLIVGSTGSGKTQLLMDILSREMLRSEGPRWNKIIFLSPTAKLQPEYFSGFPDRDVFTEPDDFVDVISRVIEHQTKVERWKPIAIIFDDVIGVFRGKKDADFVDKFNRLVTSGRLMGVFIFVLTQYIKDRVFSSTLVRSNLCFLAAAAGNISDVNREKLVELMGEGKERGEKIVNVAAEENYRFVVKDFSNKSKRPSDRVSLVKVDTSKIPKLAIRYRD